MSASGERPLFLIVGGPNGSGKSSAYDRTKFDLDDRTIWIINPDLLAARIAAGEGKNLPQANLEAVQRIEQWLDASLAAYQTVGVETVLSTEKYRRLVNKARDLGFEIFLIYVLLDSVERNIERVALRVAKGGHAVPDGKVRERHARSLQQLPWFLDHADRARIYDNSEAQPRLVGRKEDGTIVIDQDSPNDLIEAIGNYDAPARLLT